MFPFYCQQGTLTGYHNHRLSLSDRCSVLTLSTPYVTINGYTTIVTLRNSLTHLALTAYQSIGIAHTVWVITVKPSQRQRSEGKNAYHTDYCKYG